MERGVGGLQVGEDQAYLFEKSAESPRPLSRPLEGPLDPNGGLGVRRAGYSGGGLEYPGVCTVASAMMRRWWCRPTAVVHCRTAS